MPRRPTARRLSEREATELLNEQAERLIEQTLTREGRAQQVRNWRQERDARAQLYQAHDPYAEYRTDAKSKQYEWEDYGFDKTNIDIGIVKEFNEDQVAKAKRIGQIKKTDFFLVLDHIICVRPYKVREEQDHTYLTFEGFVGEYIVGQEVYSSKEDAINCLIERITNKMQKQANLFKQNKNKLKAITENPDSVIKKGFL